MDFETLIIGLLAMAVFIVPIYLIQIKQKGNSGKMLAGFRAMAAQQQLHFTRLDSWNDNYAIALDEVQQKLMYMNGLEANTPYLIIDFLKEVKKCTLINEHRDINGNRVIDRIALHLTLHSGKQREQELVFYDREQSMILSGELPLAEKWCLLISETVAKASAPANATPSVAAQAIPRTMTAKV
jgi:hypothetical protein